MPVNQAILDEVMRQNAWTDNGLYPQGVPSSYSWYPHGGGPNISPQVRGLYPNVPDQSWNAINAYTHIFPKLGEALPIAGDKIFMANTKVHLHKKTGGWITVQDQSVNSPIQGGWFVPTQDNYFPPGMTIVNRPDKVAEYDAPREPYAAHVWPTPRGTFMPGTIDGVFVTMDLWVNRAGCKLVAMSSGDWWASPTAPFPNNGGVGATDWIELTTEPQRCMYTHLTRAQLEADPTPELLEAGEPPPEEYATLAQLQAAIDRIAVLEGRPVVDLTPLDDRVAQLETKVVAAGEALAQ